MKRIVLIIVLLAIAGAIWYLYQNGMLSNFFA